MGTPGPEVPRPSECHSFGFRCDAMCPQYMCRVHRYTREMGGMKSPPPPSPPPPHDGCGWSSGRTGREHSRDRRFDSWGAYQIPGRTPTRAGPPMCSGHGCEVAPGASVAPPCLRPCTPLRRWGHGPGARQHQNQNCTPPPPERHVLTVYVLCPQVHKRRRTIPVGVSAAAVAVHPIAQRDAAHAADGATGAGTAPQGRASGLRCGQGCIGRGASEAAPAAVRQAVGGGLPRRLGAVTVGYKCR